MQYFLVVPLLLRHLASPHFKISHLLEKLYHYIAKGVGVTNPYYYGDTTHSRANQRKHTQYCFEKNKNILLDEEKFKEAIIIKQRIAFVYAVTATDNHGRRLVDTTSDNVQLIDSLKNEFVKKVSQKSFNIEKAQSGSTSLTL